MATKIDEIKKALRDFGNRLLTRAQDKIEIGDKKNAAECYQMIVDVEKIFFDTRGNGTIVMNIDKINKNTLLIQTILDYENFRAKAKEALVGKNENEANEYLKNAIEKMAKIIGMVKEMKNMGLIPEK